MTTLTLLELTNRGNPTLIQRAMLMMEMRRRKSESRKMLRSLNDHMLRDIGLTRHDVA